tara:strand:- start:23 stop:316 length:294 start_codon:yes stop_codon:yes gene_type:complete
MNNKIVFFLISLLCIFTLEYIFNFTHLFIPKITYKENYDSHTSLKPVPTITVLMRDDIKQELIKQLKIEKQKQKQSNSNSSVVSHYIPKEAYESLCP